MLKKELKYLIILILSVNLTLSFSPAQAAEAPPSSPPPAIAAQKIEPSPSVTFSAVGDIMVHNWILESAYRPREDQYDFTPIFAEVKELLSAADFTMGNLETTLPGDKKQYSAYPLFGSPDSVITALEQAGFDILTTANNHCLDKGIKGLRRTIQALDDEGLLHLGTYAGKEEYEFNRILLVEEKGIKLVFLDYTYGTNEIPVPDGCVVNLIDKNLIAQDIALAKKKEPAVIIVLFHFGEEYQRRPSEFQKDLVAFTFQEGADIILGAHPHVLQPYELKEIKDKYGLSKPRLVAYSLGNFISSQPWRYTDGGVIFNFTLKKDSASGKVSIENVNYVPVWVYVERSAKNFQFHLLPVEKYLQNDQPLKLPPAAHQKMLQFYEDTKAHLSSTK